MNNLNRFDALSIMTNLNPQENDFLWAIAGLTDAEFFLNFKEKYYTAYVYTTASGKDCDGYPKFEVHKHDNCIEALEYAAAVNEESDGIVRGVTDQNGVINYCDSWDKSAQPYL